MCKYTGDIAGHQMAGDAEGHKTKSPESENVPAFNKAFGKCFFGGSFDWWNIF